VAAPETVDLYQRLMTSGLPFPVALLLTLLQPKIDYSSLPKRITLADQLEMYNLLSQSQYLNMLNMMDEDKKRSLIEKISLDVLETLDHVDDLSVLMEVAKNLSDRSDLYHKVLELFEKRLSGKKLEALALLAKFDWENDVPHLQAFGNLIFAKLIEHSPVLSYWGEFLNYLPIILRFQMYGAFDGFMDKLIDACKESEDLALTYNVIKALTGLKIEWPSHSDYWSRLSNVFGYIYRKQYGDQK